MHHTVGTNALKHGGVSGLRSKVRTRCWPWLLDRADSWIADLPSYAAAPAPVHGVYPVMLCSVVGAIRRSETIEVKYQFLSSPEPRWRWIPPHAIALDGFRWHTRAFCLSDECFKYFPLS